MAQLCPVTLIALQSPFFVCVNTKALIGMVFLAAQSGIVKTDNNSNKFLFKS